MKKLRISLALALVIMAASTRSLANPVAVAFKDTATQCVDGLPFTYLNEEVGLMPPFDNDEDITYAAVAATTNDCLLSPAGGDDYTVTATNNTGHTLFHVYVVQNTGTTFGNWDGVITGSGGVQENAKFLIDTWPAGAMISFNLMNVAPNASPTFNHLGVPHSGSSNFSIVAANMPNIPTVSQWGIAVTALLLLSTATILIRGRMTMTATT